MKKFTQPYDYVNPTTGVRCRDVIQADTPEELREHMQAEMMASEGALTPDNFTHPEVTLEPIRARFVRVEEKEMLVVALDEANAKLKAAGLDEVAVDSEAASVEVKR